MAERVLKKCMLHDELMHPSDYLNALEFKGRDVTLTIATIDKSDLVLRGGKKKRKPVFTFTETKKKFVCNPTCADSIASMYGVKADDWIGKRITLYPTKTTFGRDTVDCIRVREKIPPAKGQASASTAPAFEEPPPHSNEPPENLPTMEDALASAGSGREPNWDLDKPQ